MPSFQRTLSLFVFHCLFLSFPGVAVSLDWFATDPSSLLFARLRCFWALYRSGFDLANFDDYPVYFRDDSVVQLAQAGSYKGAKNIEEYVKFAYADFSPYLTMEDPNNPPPELSFLGYENGQCQFLGLFKFAATMDPANTDRSVQFDYVVMLKIFYDFKGQYFTRLNVYFTNDFLRLFFDDLLNSDPTRKYVCEQVMAGPCQSQLEITDVTACKATLQALPTLEGENNHFDGNSQGCRALHAVFAETNPTQHCAHLSFPPLADPQGNIKCQTSAGVLPTDLFSEAEIAALGDFAIQYNLDPELGHNCCSDA